MIILNEATKLIPLADLGTYMNVYGLLTRKLRVSDYQFPYTLLTNVTDDRRHPFVSITNQKYTYSSFPSSGKIEFLRDPEEWVYNYDIEFRPSSVFVDITSMTPGFGRHPDVSFPQTFSFKPVINLSLKKVSVNMTEVQIKISAGKPIKLKNDKLFFNSVNIIFSTRV